MRKIKINKIQCRHCKEILESKTNHDFKICKCHRCGVDGGHEYLRRMGNPKDIIELSEYED